MGLKKKSGDISVNFRQTQLSSKSFTNWKVRLNEDAIVQNSILLTGNCALTSFDSKVA